MNRPYLIFCLGIVIGVMFCGCTGTPVHNTPDNAGSDVKATLGTTASFVGRPTPLADGKKFIQVYAHRGARSFAPENTLPGYVTGLAVGTHWVDMDVVMDKDGELVVSNDIWLNPDIVRGPDGKFPAPGRAAMLQNIPAEDLNDFIQPYLVRNMTYKELQQYDVGRLNPESPYAAYFPGQYQMDGVRMPLLKDVIRQVNSVSGGKVGFQIEFKTDPAHDNWTYTPKQFARALYDVLDDEGITQNCEIQSADWRCLYELQKLDGTVATAYLTSSDNEPGNEYSFFDEDPAIAGLWTGGKLVKDYNNSIPYMVKTLGGRCWDPEDAELTKEALDEAHRLGLKVVVWTRPEHSGTAFNRQTVERMIDWGVDGIITDDPGQLISMLAARGYSIPRRF
ncbi:MAG: glycerophosphodiester phosphodiesterase family protein [Methanoregula sp.]